jgi:hypothetical protein
MEKRVNVPLTIRVDASLRTKIEILAQIERRTFMAQTICLIETGLQVFECRQMQNGAKQKHQDVLNG